MIKMSLSTETRIELIFLYAQNHESCLQTLRAYKTKHKLHRDPFAVTTIQRLVTRFKATGSVNDSPGKGRKSLREEREEEVEKTVAEITSGREIPCCSTREISEATGFSQSNVWTVLRKQLRWYPYRTRVHQEITDGDKVHRLEFANWLLTNEDLIQRILWSDEANFTLDGSINRHNCVIWSPSPVNVLVSKGLHPEKVTVWCGISSTFVLQPYFFDSTVTGNNYLGMLEQHMLPQLDEKGIKNSTIFQQDGAPPHFHGDVTQFLKAHFPNDRVIGRGHSIRWPARSPDLSPLDFWFWGTLKGRVFHHSRPSTMNQLMHRIAEECNNFSSSEIQSAIAILLLRLHLVVESEGDVIEHLL